MPFLLGVGSVLLIWQTVTWYYHDPLFIVGPVTAFTHAITLLLQHSFWINWLSTIKRVAMGFLLAFVIGVPFGIICGTVPFVQRALKPIVDFARSLPGTALFPLFMLFLGYGTESKVAIAVYTSTWILWIQVQSAVRDVPLQKVKWLRTMGAGKLAVIRLIYLPDISSQVLSASTICLNLSLLVIVSLEFYIGSSTGLGRAIFDSEELKQIPKMFAYLLLTGMTGIALGAAPRSLIYFNRIIESAVGRISRGHYAQSERSRR